MNSQASQLIEDAGTAGVLSPGSASIIGTSNIADSIMAAIGKPPGDVVATEAVVCGVLLDDSASIGGLHQIVRDGFNGLVRALLGARHAAEIMIHCRLLSGDIICPFVEAANVPSLTTGNYKATYGETPLNRESLHLLAAVATKVQQFESDGVRARGITLLVSDGGENVHDHKDSEVATVAGDMTKSEKHIVAAMGIGDEHFFKLVFGRMGIQANWILTPSADAKEIRAAFNTFSNSAVHASKSTTSFSKTAAGGFTA